MNKEEIKLLEDKLIRCQKISLKDVDVEEIENLEDIKISKKKSSNERILDFLNTVKNPYIFKVNNKLVKIEFSNNNRVAENCITNVIKSIYR